jgi:hypothetical protein
MHDTCRAYLVLQDLHTVLQQALVQHGLECTRLKKRLLEDCRMQKKCKYSRISVQIHSAAVKMSASATKCCVNKCLVCKRYLFVFSFGVLFYLPHVLALSSRIADVLPSPHWLPPCNNRAVRSGRVHEVWDFHSGIVEDYHRMGCDTVLLGQCFPTFPSTMWIHYRVSTTSESYFTSSHFHFVLRLFQFNLSELKAVKDPVRKW